VQAHCAVQSSDVGLLVDGLCGMADAVVADAASGIVEAGFGAGPDLGVCRRTLRAALPEPGWVVWTRVPLSFKAEGDVWCPAPSDLGVMRAVKRALDADRVFSPGRLPGRL
jgi:hypothetical protein